MFFDKYTKLYWKENGKCIACGKPRLPENKNFCRFHRDAAVEYKRTRRKISSKRDKQRRENLKLLGYCVRCRKQRVNACLCTNCRKSKRKYERKRYREGY
jgi:hypothetical protein